MESLLRRKLNIGGKNQCGLLFKTYFCQLERLWNNFKLFKTLDSIWKYN